MRRPGLPPISASGTVRVDMANRVIRILAVALMVALTAPAGAQFRGPARDYATDLDYDGRFTFVRLRWKSDLAVARGGWSTAWNHDYPRAEQHLSQILDGAHRASTSGPTAA